MKSFDDKRQIRIFISSTFQDMQAERNYLITKVFPRLRVEAIKRDVTLIPLDLRWGITEEEAKSGKVLEICLQEIDNSRPFFVGILGNRYGWCPKKDELKKNHILMERWGGWLNQDFDNGLSVTEIEMQYGVLRSTQNIHACFYLKKGWSPEIGNAIKLQKLREAIIRNGRCPVGYYDTLEDLGRQVEETFMKLLNELYPFSTLSEHEKEKVRQNAFLHSRINTYIVNNDNFAVLNHFLKNPSQHNYVVTGDSGMGKSSLIANWIVAHEDDDKWNVIYYFVGNGDQGSAYYRIQRYLIEEIASLYNIELEDREVSKSEPREDMKEILLGLFLSLSNKKPLLIILDGLNQLDDSNNAKLLNWLPKPNSKVKMLFSTVNGDRTMDVFNWRNYPSFNLPPLEKSARIELIEQYLLNFRKRLLPQQVCKIVNNSLTENTLVLHTLLSELISFGIHEQIDERIDYYLSSISIEEFFQKVLERYENDFGCDFVKRILTLIGVSRDGLSEAEILSITGIRQLDWSQFYCSFQYYFTIKNGLITYGHHYIKDSVRNRYLKKTVSYRLQVINYFKEDSTPRAWDELPFQYYELEDFHSLYLFLIDFSTFSYIYQKDENELAKYWRTLREFDKDKYSLSAYLSDASSLNAEMDIFFFRVGFFCQEFFNDYKLAEKLYKRSFELNKQDGSKTWRLFNNMASLYSALCNYDKAIECLLKAIKDVERKYGLRHQNIARLCCNLGILYGNNCEYNRGEEMLNKALALIKEIRGEEHKDTAYSYMSLGWYYEEIKDFKEAEKNYKKALNIYGCLYGSESSDIGSCYESIGDICRMTNNIQDAHMNHNKALAIYKSFYGENHLKIAKIFEKIGLDYYWEEDYENALNYHNNALEIRKSLMGEKSVDVSYSYNNIGHVYNELGKYGQALYCYKNALAIREEVLGMCHKSIADNYENIGETYANMEDYASALQFHEKALEVRIGIYGSEHQNTADSYQQVGFSYFWLNQKGKAVECFQKSLEILEKKLGRHHPDTLLCYENLARLYKAIGDYDLSEKYHKMAIRSHNAHEEKEKN